MKTVTYTPEQVEEEKRAAGPALYDAVLAVMMSFHEEPSYTISESGSARLRREADRLDKRQATFEAAWKILRRIHQANQPYQVRGE